MNKKNTAFKKSLPWVIGISAFLNVLLIVYLVIQANAINRLEQIILEQAPATFEMTQKLADIERTIGYVGFIHHFKNYIIRRDEKYYTLALASHQKAIQKINEFETLTNKDELILEIEQLRATLDMYHSNLVKAQQISTDLGINVIDQLVKVDDTDADIALRSLQSYLLPKFEYINSETTRELSSLSKMSLLFNLLVAPLIILVSYFILQIINRAHKLSSQLGSILEISPDGILYISNQGAIIRANNRACELLEYTEQELFNTPIEQLVAPEYRLYCTRYREKVFSNNDVPYATYKPQKMRALTKSHKEIELEITIASGYVSDENRSVCIIRDMTHHNALKQKAEKDHLTNLINRWMLDELLQKELDRCQRSSQPLSLLLVDIDNFKSVNDNFGHDHGDETLCETAEYLKRSTRSYDHIGRWGGDEFILVCPNLSVDDAVNYAQRLLMNFHKLNCASQYNISLSIGIATSSPTSSDKRTLFKNADIALYQAKQLGKNCVTHFEQKRSNVTEISTY